jgi:hypothetical protein
MDAQFWLNLAGTTLIVGAIPFGHQNRKPVVGLWMLVAGEIAFSAGAAFSNVPEAGAATLLAAAYMLWRWYRPRKARAHEAVCTIMTNKEEDMALHRHVNALVEAYAAVTPVTVAHAAEHGILLLGVPLEELPVTERPCGLCGGTCLVNLRIRHAFAQELMAGNNPRYACQPCIACYEAAIAAISF